MFLFFFFFIGATCHISRENIYTTAESFLLNFYQGEFVCHVNLTETNNISIRYQQDANPPLWYFYQLFKNTLLKSQHPSFKYPLAGNQVCCKGYESCVLDQTYRLSYKTQSKFAVMEPCFYGLFECPTHGFPSVSDFEQNHVNAYDIATIANDVLYLHTNLSYTLVDNQFKECRRFGCPLLEFVLT